MIILDHMHVCIIITIHLSTHNIIVGTQIGDTLATRIQVPAGHVNIAIQTNHKCWLYF